MTFYKNYLSPFLYDFLDSKLIGNNDHDLFLSYSLTPHLIDTECQLNVIVLDSYFLTHILFYLPRGNEGSQGVFSLPKVGFEPRMGMLSPYLANPFLIIPSTVPCLDLVHSLPSKSEN